MVHNIHINGGNKGSFHTFYTISYGKLNIQKLIELVYQIQSFNTKIISTSFKTRENAFTETRMAQCIFFENIQEAVI